MLRRAALLTVLVAVAPARGQVVPDTVALPVVGVTATRSADGPAAAFSVAAVERAPAERAADDGETLARSLRRVPGLAVVSRENPAQGERLAVRGLGARAAFGVRGVQVVLDGVPLTLADGQAVLGIADPALVRRAEIVRGPASALWGNASGGVLVLETIPTADGASARVAGGSGAFVRAEAEAAVTRGALRAGASASHTQADGYRDHSALAVTRARAFAEGRLAPSTTLRWTAAAERAPTLEHPGALTADELAADRRQAEARYVETASGKASHQVQTALALAARTPAGALDATVYGLARDLDNPLPFAYIAVDRLAGGVRVALDRPLGPARLTLGVDAAVQRDARTNRDNAAGEPGATLLLDQTETVTQAAAFGRVRLPLGARVAVEGALRADRVRFAAADRLLADGDQSGARTLGALSPSVGASVRVGGALVFASVATAFETPTTTELVNRPDGGGGFNPDLEPQRTLGVEAGVRGTAGAARYDAAVYGLDVRDGLAPFEGAGGRTFYANRDRTRHHGAEAAVAWQPSPGLSLAATYAWTVARFGADAVGADGSDVGGNRVPGVPRHRLGVRVQAEHRGLFVAPEVEAASGVAADDAGTVRTRGWALVDVSVGHTGVRAGRARLSPFVRVQNVLGADAVASVVANARGGRYYEPAAGRLVRAGVGVRW